MDDEIQQLRHAHEAMKAGMESTLAESIADGALGGRAFYNDVARQSFIREILPAVRSAGGRGVFEGQPLIDYVKSQLAGDFAHVLSRQGEGTDSGGSGRAWKLDDIKPGMPASEMAELMTYMRNLAGR